MTKQYEINVWRFGRQGFLYIFRAWFRVFWERFLIDLGMDLGRIWDTQIDEKSIRFRFVLWNA